MATDDMKHDNLERQEDTELRPGSPESTWFFLTWAPDKYKSSSWAIIGSAKSNLRGQSCPGSERNA